MKSAQVHSGDGSPGLYLDGRKTVPILYGLSDIPASGSNTAQAQRNIRLFAEQGVNLVTADTGLHLGWHKASPFETEPLREEIAGVLDANPGAGVILRLHLNPPYWWMRDFPEETVRYGDAPGLDDGESDRLIRCDGERHMRVSLASRKWLDKAGELLRTFCEEVWDTPEGRQVIGIQVACGIYGEWHQWGPDCSRPMTERFRRMLWEQYGSDEALQKAWGRSDVTIDSAPFCPDTDRPGDDGLFRDPVTARDTMHAQRCLQITPPEAILHFCRIIKKSWGRPVLTGSFFGYFLGAGGSNAVIGGHLMVDLLYRERETIDFLCGPFPYMQNRRADGVPMSRGLLESTRLHGMLWLTEMDQHPVGTESFVGGDPAHQDETIAQLRRNILLPVLAGMGCWYYDHRIIPSLIQPRSQNSSAGSIYRKKGWWDQPDLLREVGRLQKLAETYALRPYRPAADVLLVYDTESYFAQCRIADEEYALHEAVSRTGAAYDCIYLKDLELAEMERYRCVIFANAYLLTPEQREIIRRTTMGREVVWLYAPGFSDSRTLSEEHIRETTGIAVKRIGPETGYQTLNGVLPPCRVELDSAKFDPVFAAEDPEAEPLAFYKESGACAAARKGHQWYFALPFLQKETTRAIFREAGVHCYCDTGDPVLAGAGLVALNSAQGGKRTVVFRSGKQTECELTPFTTAVFDAETGERLL